MSKSDGDQVLTARRNEFPKKIVHESLENAFIVIISSPENFLFKVLSPPLHYQAQKTSVLVCGTRGHKVKTQHPILEYLTQHTWLGLANADKS